MTNTGWTSSNWTGDSVFYWKVNSASEFSAAQQLSGELTMGWDFSAITGRIASIELKTRHVLFQFDQWNDEAYLDEIAGYISTPAVFGAGAETQLYKYTGNKPVDFVPGNTAIGSQALMDVAPLNGGIRLRVSSLLELRFDYNLANLDIPARHVELFRDDTGLGDDGFVFRVTLEPTPAVPLPASLPMVVVGLLGLYGLRARGTSSTKV